MAKQRPSLGVTAAPVSTYVAPMAAAAELYDQQTVNLALQFSEAFKDLSLTAAKFAGGLKAQSNEEDLRRGLDLVNQSQQTYQQLVESGQIKPSENPWLAIGAQQGSGAMEGMKARAHFMQTYEKRAAEDPKFFDNADSFNALASQYAQNVGTTLKDSPYMSRAFFESFNPFVASMSLKHEERVVQAAEEKVAVGIGASVAQLVQDARSMDPIVRAQSMQVFENSIVEAGRMGLSQSRVNQAVVDNMIAVMKQTDQLDQMEVFWNSMKSGTGLLKDTKYAKAAYESARAAIEENRQKITSDKDNQWLDYVENSAPAWVNRNMTRQDVIQAVRDNPVWQGLSVGEQRSKMSHALSRWSEESTKRQREDAEATQDAWFKGLGRVISTDLTLQEDPDQWAADSKAQLKTLTKQLGFSETEAFRYVQAAESNIDGMVKQHKAQVEEAKNEQILVSATNLATNPPADLAGLSEEEYAGAARQVLEAQMEGIPEARKITIRNYLDESLKAYEEKRKVARLVSIQQSVDQANDAVLGPAIQQFVAGQSSEIPPFAEAKARLDSILVAQGVVLTSPEARKVYDLEVQKRAEGLRRLRESTDLRPSENEQENQARAATRQRLMVAEMSLGAAFGSRLMAAQTVDAMRNLLTPENVETSDASLAAFDDLLQAYATAQRNGIDISTLMPTGDAGKALDSEVRWALNQYRSGVSPKEIARDLSQRKFFGQRERITPEAMLSPLAWMDTSAKGTDLETLQSTALSFAEKNITQSDSTPFFMAEFRRNYMDALEQTKDHDKAVETANDKLTEDYAVVRGALIPVRGLPQANMDPVSAKIFMETWLESKFPGRDATLVVVSEDPDGTPVMAARLPNGESVPGDRRVYRPQDIVMTEKEVTQFGASLKKTKGTPDWGRYYTP